MKLSKLYSNQPTLFEPINFVDGLNVVVAEIRLPKNHNKDTHNLGKTTLGSILDFCFLSTRHKDFFLFKHTDLFKEFIFFLELELADSSLLTICRGVENASKIRFKKHKDGLQDFSMIPGSEWDHLDLPFDRACKVLDGLLDWRILKPWTFRHGLGYLLRKQDDFQDVFQLQKFAGPHSEWKPFLAHLLGFDAELLLEHYKKEGEIKKEEQEEKIIENELGGTIEDISKIEGILLLKKKDMEKKQQTLDAFDFRANDKDLTMQLVNNVDERIATLNAKRYSLNKNKRKITASLKEDQMLFDPDEAQRLFKEVEVSFEGQIKKDYQQLIAFNRAITTERSGYLKKELVEIEGELKIINIEINDLGRLRSRTLASLSETDVFEKYKQVSNGLVDLRAEIIALERQQMFLHRLQEKRSNIRSLKEKYEYIQSQIERDVEQKNADNACLFSLIRIYFSEIVEEVIDRKALLSVIPNQHGHLEFSADILDESGNATSADIGHTYRKLLCIAFDLAILRAYLQQSKNFPNVVFHDGVFESLDDRKKIKLLSIIRRYVEFGIQPVITLIDSDLPSLEEENKVFDESEIVLRLHDESDQGRLFKMKAW